MNGFLAVYRREVLSLWVTPLAWVLLTVFLLLQGAIFYSIITHFTSMAEASVDTGPLQAYFGQESIFLLMTLLLVCPALTMRVFAEERRSGTIEALLTAPVTPASVVLGKYAALLTTYALIWAPTLLYVVILRKTGVVDWGVVGSSYLGLLGIGAAYLSVGTLMSAMTKSQLVALLLTIFVEFGLFILGVGEYIFDPGLFRDICAHVSMMSQMEDFSKGILDLRRIVFDGSVTALGLFITTRVVDSLAVGMITRSFKAFAALGVLGAALLAVNANVLVARWYKRWDVTADKLYTLSPATLKTLHTLDQPINIVVLLGRADPLSVSVRQMLVQYGAETRKLAVKYVDPDQNPAEFQVLQKDLGLLTGRADDGRVVTDASLVISRGERHWFITSEELVHYDDQTGKAQPRLEQALTEGIANVLSTSKAKACFATGHRELSLDDVGPEGLAEVRHRLEKSNFEVTASDLAAPGTSLAECTLLVVPGPSVEIDHSAATRIVDFIKGGGSAFVLAAPVLGEDHHVQPSGLQEVAQLIGVELGQDFILETDAALRLPRGVGEVFFATPLQHEVTRGLEREGVKVDSRVLVSGAQSLRIGSNSPAKPLLASSDKALSLHDLGPLLDANHKDDPIENAPRGAYTLAVAAELPKPPGSTAKYGPRVVIAGAVNLVWGRNYSDSSLYGDRLFSENALSWLSARPTLVSVPEKTAHEVGLSLSEESLAEVLRYVLIYMPGCAAALGVFVLMRRRSVEKKSRQSEPT